MYYCKVCDFKSTSFNAVSKHFYKKHENKIKQRHHRQFSSNSNQISNENIILIHKGNLDTQQCFGDMLMANKGEFMSGKLVCNPF